MKPYGPLLLVCILFLVLTGLFSAATPYRQAGILRHQRSPSGGPQPVVDVGAPDERQHANYVSQLMAGQFFPVLDPKSPESGENYEAHQPPLAYLLEAGWCKLFGVQPSQSSNGFLVRLPSSILGVLTLLGIYCGLFWGWKDRDVALAGTTFAGLLPMNIGLHAGFSNDPLVIALMTWSVTFMIRTVGDDGRTRDLWIAAVLVGLGLLTKTTAIAALPLILGTGLLVLKRKQGAFAGIAIALPVGMALPWWIRNLNLYGDFLGLKIFESAFAGSPHASLFIDNLGASTYWLNMVLWWTTRSFVGAFGYMDIFLFEGLRPDQGGALYNAIFLVLAILGLIGLAEVGRRFKGKEAQAPTWILGGLLLTVVALFVKFNMTYFQGQARYLFPALLSVSLLAGLGATRILRRKPEIAWIAVGAFMLILCFFAYQGVVEGFPLRQAIGSSQ